MNKDQALALARFEANTNGQIRYVFAEGSGFVVRRPIEVTAEEIELSVTIMPEPGKHPTLVKV